ncbi:phosphatase PAP2-related protein [Xanthocytophaga agilis]|uniref:Phosphatase PAP2-related protein n=1 Tax=Xanthocytophaga agilis TaxID=3048010 RepID=A0AAE3UHF2_9BACT|nr:phosphatase PAP2-related protein [Xanthocytophaga agilis]MDJ1505963.1 phosphatase PAP2-related protein [Xanthocytophaga agilis]
MQKYWTEVKASWHQAWQNTIFRKKLIGSLFSVLILLATFPVFFQYIVKREGMLLHDWLLVNIPAIDVSIWVFLAIWGMVILSLIRFAKEPDRVLLFLVGYTLVSVLRIITILTIPLNPPVGLIELTDPLSNAFYGKSFVTKDLFFSGHTSSVFLMFLCLQRPVDRLLGLLATVLVGAGVLVQHVHYSIDVLAAPVLTYLCWLIARKIIRYK